MTTAQQHHNLHNDAAAVAAISASCGDLITPLVPRLEQRPQTAPTPILIPSTSTATQQQQQQSIPTNSILANNAATTINQQHLVPIVPIIPIKPTSRGRTYRIPNTSDNSALGIPNINHANNNAAAAIVNNNPNSNSGTASIVNSNNNNNSSSSSSNANTATATAPATNAAGTNNNNATTATNNNNAIPDSLWATREIAALDFLMNVPLHAEREIVRAGLSGERWHRHTATAAATATAVNAANSSSLKSNNNNSMHHGTMQQQHHQNHHVSHATTPSSSSGFGAVYGDGDMSSYSVNRNSIMDEEDGRMMSEATTSNTSSTMHSLPMGSGGGGNGGGGEGNKTQGGSWWDKLILKDKRFFSAANLQAQRRERLEKEEQELERPDSMLVGKMDSNIGVTRGGGGGGSGSGGGGRYAHGGAGMASYGNMYTTKGAIPNTPTSSTNTNGIATTTSAGAAAGAAGVPGRRLDGRDAVTVTIPEEFRCRPPRTVARQVAVREWEIKVAWHGVDSGDHGGAHHRHHHHHHHHSSNHHHHHHNHSKNSSRKAMLDGRIFFSTRKSYPVAVFSTIKYEPQKEEAARRRKKLEELGGGGTQFVLPERDWRGISYRALLPQVEDHNKAFNRLIASSGPSSIKKKRKDRKKSPRGNDRSSGDDNSSFSDDGNDDNASTSSSDGNTYFPGFLDDPQMVQGRHRHVMIGDKVTGPIVSSTIQFVKPSVLKADLNKQFRERFDKWEPPRSQRKFIGAKVIDGNYTLIDPTETVQDDVDDDGDRRQSSGSMTGEREIIRLPPSLTLSKIRSVKQHALVACIRSKIEISTLALACIYFERLCLDCRVDKSNRRLSFAACLLLAAKVNESNSMIVYDRGDGGVEPESKQSSVLNSWVKPNKKSNKIFESLVVFFTHDWSLSMKQLYAAEWIVFTALGFSLTATPSAVAFHFKRLLKVLEWDPRSYLGPEMYNQWQQSLVEDSLRKERSKARKELRIKKNELKLMKLQRKLHLQQTEEVKLHRSTGSDDVHTRRHSVSSSLFRSDSNEDSFIMNNSETTLREDFGSPGKSQRGLIKGDGTPAIRGLLSRLARTKQSSVEKDMDKFSKAEKTVIKHSVSVPNMSSLAGLKTGDNFAIDFKMIQEDSQIAHSDEHDEIQEKGLFV